MPIKSLLIKSSLIAAGVSLLVLGGVSYYSSSLLLYPGKMADTPGGRICDKWLDRAYQDTSDSDSRGQALTKSCQEHLATTQIQSITLEGHQGFKSQLVEFTSLSANSKGVWLHIPGLNGNYLHGARYYDVAKRLGQKFYTLEYINHGDAEIDGLGAGWGCKEKSDVKAAIQYLSEKYPSQKIMLTSTSMGTMASALSLGELGRDQIPHNVGLVVFESPISNVYDLVRHTPGAPPVPEFVLNLSLKMAEYRSQLNLSQADCRPTDALANLKVPALVITSKMDKITPRPLAEKFTAAIPKNVLLKWQEFPVGTHSRTYNSQPKKFEALLINQMQDNLGLSDNFEVSKVQKGY